MTKKIIISIAVIFLGCVVGWILAIYENGSHALSQESCMTIHEPKAGCPKNWQRVAAFFHEESGVNVAACIAPQTAPYSMCIDELRPGESFTFEAVPQTEQKKVNDEAKPPKGSI